MVLMKVVFTFSERSLKNNISHHVLRYLAQVQKRTNPNNITTEGLTKFWKIKLLEQMSLTWSPRVRERTPGILASSSSPSSPRNQTITSKPATSTERSIRAKCYALPELHKSISMPQRPFDAKDTTTHSRDLKYTWYLHLDLSRSITKWESMSSRSSIQLLCASQS